MTLLVLLGCSPSPAPAPSSDVRPGIPGGTCPADMVPVPTGAPAFCIDAWEDVVVDGVAASRAGERPTVGLTFDQAVEACVHAEVRDASGAVVGHKRMPLATEWEDAADGTLGPGGHAYPYGDAWIAGACNVPERLGDRTRWDVLPTGSREACRTEAGAFDLLGNAWEWTDSGVRLDVAGWFAAVARERLPIGRAEDGRIVETGTPGPGSLGRLRLVVNSVPPGALEVDATGALVLKAGVGRAELFRAGFLAVGTPADPPRYLPIALEPVDPAVPTGRWLLRVRDADDGAPLPDKRGCAWYAGAPDICRASTAGLAHPHDFSGTIAARCVADPIPPAG